MQAINSFLNLYIYLDIQRNIIKVKFILFNKNRILAVFVTMVAILPWHLQLSKYLAGRVYGKIMERESSSYS